MQNSILERLFPKPKQSLLPQYDERLSQYQDDENISQTSLPARSGLNSNASIAYSFGRGSSRSKSPEGTRSHISQQPAPLSASIIHYDDPFIAVDRAAATLQRTIQSLLDFQSHALGTRTSDDLNDSLSQRSATPTPSSAAGSARSQVPRLPGVVPVRQPVRKKMTLRSAREGIGRSMHEFIALKDEELKIAQLERTNRQAGLEKIADFHTKRDAVDHQISLLRDRAASDQHRALRDETEIVEKEIKELEDKLAELRARHRHLVNKLTQDENASASQLSSYEGTIAVVDKDIRRFLRRPPIKQGLGPRNLSTHRDGLAQAQDLYALRPERRTLQLAHEQWAKELELLSDHEAEIEKEKHALLEGVTLWREVVTRVDQFERSLRQTLKDGGSQTTQHLLSSLDSAFLFLQTTLNKAEAQDWTLLVCAVGAELEAFREARLLLAPEEPLPQLHMDQQQINSTRPLIGEDDDVPHADLLDDHFPDDQPFDVQLRKSAPVDEFEQSENGEDVERSVSPVSSNPSLKATLKEFPGNLTAVNKNSNSRTLQPIPQRGNGTKLNTTANSYPESEDDDPGPDFLVSYDD